MKDSLYYLKWPLLLLLAGFLVRTAGAMIKILHWTNADMILIIGSIIIIVAISWLVLKIFSLKKKNN